MKRDCSDEVEFKNGKATPFGWSTAELWHNGEQIGDHYCGDVKITHPQYSFSITPEGSNKRLTIFCEIGEDGIA